MKTKRLPGKVTPVVVPSKGKNRIPYRPVWPGPIQGHAINTCRYYFGRLHPWYELDDLLQEGFMVFLKCRKAYTGKVDNPAWFMALFRNSLRNRFSNIVKKASRYNPVEDDESIYQLAMDDTTYVECLLKELPPVLDMMTRLASRDKLSVQQRYNTQKLIEEWIGFAPTLNKKQVQK